MTRFKRYQRRLLQRLLVGEVYRLETEQGAGYEAVEKLSNEIRDLEAKLRERDKHIEYLVETRIPKEQVVGK